MRSFMFTIDFLPSQQLLARVARSENTSKVLLGDSGNLIAIRLLSSFTQGAGAHLAHEAVNNPISKSQNRLLLCCLLKFIFFRDLLIKDIKMFCSFGR